VCGRGVALACYCIGCTLGKFEGGIVMTFSFAFGVLVVVVLLFIIGMGGDDL
jgi:hypothetical protein